MRFFDSFARRARMGSTSSLGGYACDLPCSFGWPEPCGQDFCCLARPQFLAVLDTVKRKPECGQEVRHSFDGSLPLLGKASLRVFGLAFGGPVLDKIEAHRTVSRPLTLCCEVSD